MDKVIVVFNDLMLCKIDEYLTVEQILIFFITIVIFNVFRKKVTNFFIKHLKVFVNKIGKVQLAHHLEDTFIHPLRFLIVVFGFTLAIQLSNLDITHYIEVGNVLDSVYIISIGYFLLNISDYMISSAFDIYSNHGKKSFNKNLAMISINLSKGVIVIGSLIYILIIWEFNVSGLVASLGVGGLAFALAAKDTLSNFFGSFTIATDKPFDIGDWVVINGNVEGTVTSIGIRSTLIRTFSNGLITIPNYKVANSEILNWSKRKYGRQIKWMLGVEYKTEVSKIKTVIKEITKMLKDHDGILESEDNVESSDRGNHRITNVKDTKGIKDTLFVRLTDFSPSSLDIQLYCFTKTTVWMDYLEIREDIMYNILDIMKKNKVEFAFPTQTLFIENS